MKDIEEKISALASHAIENRIFPGCVVGVVHREGERTVYPYGSLTYDENSTRVKAGTIYDLASVTKSIPTASLALQYIEEGRLFLDDKLIDFVPEFRNSDRSKVTIEHLLTYTVGGYPLSPYKNSTPKELFEIVMRRDFSVRPGTGFSYANVPAFLLGLVIERIGKHSLEIQARQRFFGHLHMDSTSFFPKHFLTEQIAPTEIDPLRGVLQGQVHDESAYVFTVLGEHAVGHAGLFSNVPDLLIFLEMLLNEGEFHGHHYFAPATLKVMRRNYVGNLGASAGLGWQLNDPHFMGQYAGPRTFGKTGFTGTSVVVDIERGVAFTILSNRTYPKRPQSDADIFAFRAAIADIVFESL